MRHYWTLLFILLATVPLSPSRAEIIAQARSLYRNILVVREDDRLCLRFTLKKHAQNQSCKWLADPKRLVFDYTKMMAVAIAALPQAPKRVLMIGLGGGTLVEVLHWFYPNTSIDVVEIDPVVVKMAKRYFGFVESPKVKVNTQDGRVFVKRAQLAQAQYDLIILDAFNGDYIPPHLMTQEFLNEVREILSPNGTVLANTFATSRLKDLERATYLSVFKNIAELQGRDSGNRILIYPGGQTVNAINTRLRRYLRELKTLGVDVPAILENYRPLLAPPRTHSILTDDYAPVNILNTTD